MHVRNTALVHKPMDTVLSGYSSGTIACDDPRVVIAMLLAKLHEVHEEQIVAVRIHSPRVQNATNTNISTVTPSATPLRPMSSVSEGTSVFKAHVVEDSNPKSEMLPIDTTVTQTEEVILKQLTHIPSPNFDDHCSDRTEEGREEIATTTNSALLRIVGGEERATTTVPPPHSLRVPNETLPITVVGQPPESSTPLLLAVQSSLLHLNMDRFLSTLESSRNQFAATCSHLAMPLGASFHNGLQSMGHFKELNSLSSTLAKVYSPLQQNVEDFIVLCDHLVEGKKGVVDQSRTQLEQQLMDLDGVSFITKADVIKLREAARKKWNMADQCMYEVKCLLYQAMYHQK